MARSRASILVGVMLANAVWVSATAAQTALEIGVDAGLQIDGNGTDANVRTWGIPIRSVRAGLHVGAHTSLEAALGASRVELLNSIGEPTATNFEFGVSGLYHFGTDRSARRLHLLLGVPFRYGRVGDDTGTVSDSEYGILGGVGMTIPVRGALALRLQAQGIGWRHSTTRLSFLVGISTIVD